MPSSDDSVFKLFHGFAEMKGEPDGSLRLSRVPFKLLPSLNQRVNIRTFSPAGAELRFRLKGSPLRVRLRRMPDGNEIFSRPGAAIVAGLFRGDFQEAWIALREGDNEIDVEPFQGSFEPLARARSRYSPELNRIVLPPFVELRLLGVDGSFEPARPADAPKLKYLAYGSSITQGAYALTGDSGYPAVVARVLGVDVLNLGFGGGAHLEPELAEWIVSRDDWSFASLEMGINVFGLSVDEFRLRVRRFLSVFASDVKRRPALCLDLLAFKGELDGSAKEKADAFRRVVSEERIALGASHLHGLEYAGGLERVSDLSFDLLHPASHAFASIGRHLAAQAKLIPEIARLLGS